MESSNEIQSGKSFPNKGIKLSSLESDVLLSELYCKLVEFPDEEKTKVVTSWLANSFADLTNSENATGDSINSYVIHIKLFNTLVSNSAFDKTLELAECFLKDFLYAFVLPSLKDQYQSNSQISSATEYFRIACENVSQPLLVRKIVEFIITRLLPTLLARLNNKDNNKILVSTLNLFKTLLEFYCEDFWYELILQYLLPMKHLLVSERQKVIEEIDFLESALILLESIPGCISENINPEVLAEQFVLYVEQELNRIEDIDSAVSLGVPLSKSLVTGIPLFEEANNPQNFETDSRNPIFSLWAFKYDGTDVLHASRKYSFQEPEEYFEDDMFLYMINPHENKNPQENTTGSSRKSSINNNHIINVTDLDDIDSEGENFQLGGAQLRVLTSSETNLKPLKSSPTTNDSIYIQRKNSDVSSHAAYLGPFLDNLYKLLEHWTRLDHDVIVMISEIFSVLDSSRLPLVSTLFLDMAIILQPSYPSFSTIMHNIKLRLDGSMQKCPAWFVKQIWQQANSGTTSLLHEKQRVAENKNTNDMTSVTDVLKSRVLNSKPFNFITKLSGGNSVTVAALTKILSQGSTQYDNRVLNRSATGFESKEQETMARNMSIRCILFTHWMLELAAIAHQLCWSQSKSN